MLLARHPQDEFNPYHPQSNGQVEAINKTNKTKNLKEKLESLKEAWVDELPMVLWAYGTTSQMTTGETPFSLAFGVEAIVVVEFGLTSYWTKHYDENHN